MRNEVATDEDGATAAHFPKKRTNKGYVGLLELGEFGPGASTSKKSSNVWWQR